jgi:uncharacterized protein with PIN domain
MLGKLTRWLRMLGQDVEYFKQLEDSELLDIARNEHRILLTRDMELYQRATAKGIQVYYLEGKTEPEKLAEIAIRFEMPLKIDMEKSRCPMCNSKIESIPKEQMKGKLEGNTFANYDSFWRCPKCGKIYWQGAHWGRIRDTLGKAEDILRKNNVA